ncbi:alkene reductase [Acidicapsa ligni]|uniref:alkene reductase n=1 Tax=Acidicapsa ligni TaxID=542300 RepID=UPI00295BB869|nr:alkene reductase [Acidicapsa ligni]
MDILEDEHLEMAASQPLTAHPIDMSNFSHLFSPLQVGELHLAHRVVLAPLTRLRSTQPGDVPNALNATYYGQRASRGGLLISEATQISLQGKGYPAAPGIHSPEQVEGWKLVTQAVHEKKAYIFLQLWHVGRISHSSLHPDEGLPVSASAIAPANGQLAFTADFKHAPFETPRALGIEELPGIVADYRRAAENAKAAGFDGVEIHGANGYLLDQFLEDKTNHRTDIYGSSIENRARLLLEVVDATIEVWGKGRVGVRLSPYGTFSDMGDSNPVELFNYVLEQLSQRGVAYAHLVEPRVGSAGNGDPIDDSRPRTSHIFRNAFDGVLISAGGYTADTAEETIADGYADTIAFGRLFIANPDLSERFRINAELNTPDRSTFYGGTDKGYIDYPSLVEVQS